MNVFSRSLAFVPRKLRKLLIVPAAISLIALYQHYIQVGLDPLLSLLVDEYEKALNFLLGWAAPLIEQIARRLGWDITLYSHWRHILVLLGLYFFSGASIEKEEHKLGRPSSWQFRLILGIIIAVLTSVLLGAISVTTADVSRNFLIALVAFSATAMNDLLLRAYRGWRTLRYETTERVKGDLPTRWKYFSDAAIPIVTRTFVGLVIAFPAILIVRHTTAPGVVILMLFVLYLALNQIYVGARELGKLRNEGEAWQSAASRSRGILIGTNMLWVFVVAIAALTISIAKELAATHL